MRVPRPQSAEPAEPAEPGDHSAAGKHVARPFVGRPRRPRCGLLLKPHSFEGLVNVWIQLESQESVIAPEREYRASAELHDHAACAPKPSDATQRNDPVVDLTNVVTCYLPLRATTSTVGGCSSTTAPARPGGAESRGPGNNAPLPTPTTKGGPTPPQPRPRSLWTPPSNS